MHNVTLAVINTTFLLGSSVTVRIAHHDLLHKKRKTFIGLLAATIVLGLCFLGFTALEWQELLATGDPTENLYLAAFFSITGLHGLHVILGLTMLTVALVRGTLGHFTPKLNNGMEVPTAYWHLVDGVWIFVLLFVYIVPTFYQGPNQVLEAVDPFSVYEREMPADAGGAGGMPAGATMPADSMDSMPAETPAEPQEELRSIEDRTRSLNERLRQLREGQ